MEDNMFEIYNALLVLKWQFDAVSDRWQWIRHQDMTGNVQDLLFNTWGSL